MTSNNRDNDNTRLPKPLKPKAPAKKQGLEMPGGATLRRVREKINDNTPAEHPGFGWDRGREKLRMHQDRGAENFYTVLARMLED